MILCLYHKGKLTHLYLLIMGTSVQYLMPFFSASRQTEINCFVFFIQLILNTLMMIDDDEMFALPTKTM